MGRFKDLWNRNNDGERAEERSFIRYAIVVTFIIILFLFVFKKDSVFRWIEAGFIIRQQEKQIEYYVNETERMDREISDLTENRDSLEKFAREKYDFARPGEDVYILE